ncbi:hypothetical protein WJX74_006665 [Apatococcus lobatus]|uniref:Uncharacterized protein n=1 Tax=Apatococcus lobatus TaxID=904363 RepID=A0AAW1S2A7_9CHLO
MVWLALLPLRLLEDQISAASNSFVFLKRCKKGPAFTESPLRVQHVTPAAQKLQPAAAARANQARALAKAGQFHKAAGLFQELLAEKALGGSCSLWLACSCVLHGCGDASGCQEALSTAEAYCNTPMESAEVLAMACRMPLADRQPQKAWASFRQGQDRSCILDVLSLSLANGTSRDLAASVYFTGSRILAAAAAGNLGCELQ